MGIAYDPEKKYDGINGQKMGIPEIPHNLKCC
jgi:hypothetical protein